MRQLRYWDFCYWEFSCQHYYGYSYLCRAWVCSPLSSWSQASTCCSCSSRSFAVAILRYRLWEIDVIINRTLVYGTLTASLALVHVALVIGLQALLRGLISQDNSVAIVISTVLIAALFQPLRSRIQRVIDRRFYRRKYDAVRTLEAFSTTLRNEVDLATLSEQLVAVVQETMQPTHVSLWLRYRPESEVRRARGGSGSSRTKTEKN